MNWPNGLTLGRLILGPVVLASVLTGRVRLAFFLFVVAMLSDLYDGYIARLRNQVTEFGKLMDPLADKVLVSAVLIGLMLVGLPYVPLWIVAVILGRELLILGCRTGVVKSGEGFVTSRIAKLKTAVQMIWVALILLYLSVSPSLRIPDAAHQRIEGFLYGLAIAAVSLTIISGVEYLLNGHALAARGGAQVRPGEEEGRHV